MFLRRPGSQSQFSVPLWSAQPSSDPIRTVVDAVHSAPGARHGIEDLAARAGLSPRHLQRHFTAELGVPPAAYVLVTTQGVSAGIDMALWLIGRLHGREHARSVRREIQYEPAPPYLADEPVVV
ncbi:MAG: hypothetical protein ACJ72W_11295 [Actinoallomurus sp.]